MPTFDYVTTTVKKQKNGYWKAEYAVLHEFCSLSRGQCALFHTYDEAMAWVIFQVNYFTKEKKIEVNHV